MPRRAGKTKKRYSLTLEGIFKVKWAIVTYINLYMRRARVIEWRVFELSWCVAFLPSPPPRETPQSVSLKKFSSFTLASFVVKNETRRDRLEQFFTLFNINSWKVFVADALRFVLNSFIINVKFPIFPQVWDSGDPIEFTFDRYGMEWCN